MNKLGYKRLLYSISQVNKIGLGVPTTCGYRFIYKHGCDIKSENIRALFYMAELDACIRIGSDYYHYFHSYAFHHQTVFPLILKNDTVSYSTDICNVMAWGGGSVDKNEHIISPTNYDEETEENVNQLKSDMAININDFMKKNFPLYTKDIPMNSDKQQKLQNDVFRDDDEDSNEDSDFDPLDKSIEVRGI